MLLEEIKEYTQNKTGTSKINYLGKWNGYDVYEPYEFNEQSAQISGGYPSFILVNGNNIQYYCGIQSLDIASKFFDEDGQLINNYGKDK